MAVSVALLDLQLLHLVRQSTSSAITIPQYQDAVPVKVQAPWKPANSQIFSTVH